MAGFRKIELSSQQTLRDHLEYIWIDTCCIDKSSSAELSVAINSMFAWYQNADVCYAYLKDVALGVEAIPDLDDGGMLTEQQEEYLLASSFANSQWFIRGWTLQELAAPSKVIFCDNSFGFISTKRSHAYLVSLITGIDEGLLCGQQGLEDVLGCWPKHQAYRRSDLLSFRDL